MRWRSCCCQAGGFRQPIGTHGVPEPPCRLVTAFYNHRGTTEQWIEEGNNAIKWTRLSCRKFRNNEVRLQLYALACNLANFMRMLALPKAGGVLAADHDQGEAGQDRGEGRRPWPLRHVPDGGGRRASRPVAEHSAADRQVATTILGDGLNGGTAGMTEGEVCSDEMETVQNWPPRAVRQRRTGPAGSRCGSWFSATTRADLG